MKTIIIVFIADLIGQLREVDQTLTAALTPETQLENNSHYYCEMSFLC